VTTTATTAITVRAATSEADARAIPPIAAPAELRLDALRRKLGAWMRAEDMFLSRAKVPIEPASEPDWTVPDVWDAATSSVVLIQRAVAAAPVRITVVSAEDATDLTTAASPVDVRQVKLDGLRTMLGVWLLERDRFLDKEKAAIERAQEAQWPVADVITGTTALIRRDAPTMRIRLKRGEAPEVDSAVRFAAATRLAEVRRGLVAHGEMEADDAFLQADGRDQVPIGDEATLPLRAVLKGGTLQLTSRSGWG
jgi:hypothetical protein